MTTEVAISKMDEREQARMVCWYTGNLRYLLDSTQKKIYDAFRLGKYDTEFFYANCARQIGKTWVELVLALEDTQRHPRAEVKFAAPTQKEARSIIRPILAQLLERAPDSFRKGVSFNGQDGIYKFPNGSVLTVAGCDGENYERLRGQHAHAIYVDEAAFISDLRTVLMSVLSPQTITTGGRIFVGSTPADSAGHYSTELARKCESLGAFIKLDVYQNARISRETIEKKRKEYGGDHATAWRREYLCEFVTDTANALIPSFPDAKDAICQPVKRPDYFDAYTSIDLGYTDATAALFGFYDYERATICIEDEWVEARANSDRVMEMVATREGLLWGNKEPLMRVTDVDPRFQADFSARGFLCKPAQKTNLHAAVNKLDVWIQTGRVQIDPKCTTLIRQLYNATWDASRKKFRRDEATWDSHRQTFRADETCDYHYDAVAAMVYLVRSVAEWSNPFPAQRFDIPKQWVNMEIINEREEKDFGGTYSTFDEANLVKEWGGNGGLLNGY